MFPTRLPWLYVLQILAVLAVIVVTLVLTQNPLALLGLNFLPQVPLVHDPEQMARAQILEDNVSDQSRIGFTADIG
jgi:hypothetical protein